MTTERTTNLILSAIKSGNHNAKLIMAETGLSHTCVTNYLRVLHTEKVIIRKPNLYDLRSAIYEVI